MTEATNREYGQSTTQNNNNNSNIVTGEEEAKGAAYRMALYVSDSYTLCNVVDSVLHLPSCQHNTNSRDCILHHPLQWLILLTWPSNMGTRVIPS